MPFHGIFLLVVGILKCGRLSQRDGTTREDYKPTIQQPQPQPQQQK
jgi:hypothetical protein